MLNMLLLYQFCCNLVIFIAIIFARLLFAVHPVRGDVVYHTRGMDWHCSLGCVAG